MTRTARVTRAIVAASAVSLALVGCVATPTPTNTPTPVVTVEPTPTPAPSPTPTSTPTTTLTAGQQDAARVVERYYEILDQIALDKNVPLDSLYQAASGEVARAQLRGLQQSHVNGWVSTGRVGVDVRGVTGTEAPYVVEACLDTSQVKVVDQAGNSMTPEDQPSLKLWHFTVEDINGRLLVMEEEAVATSC